MPTPRVRHLRYEVQMLGETIHKLVGPEVTDQVTTNAL